jgi:hypothetical protein
MPQHPHPCPLAAFVTYAEMNSFLPRLSKSVDKNLRFPDNSYAIASAAASSPANWNGSPPKTLALVVVGQMKHSM